MSMFPDWQPSYDVTVTTYQDGQPMGSRAVVRETDQSRARDVAASYVADYVVQGGTATYDQTTREFRIGMSDRTVVYVKVWTP